MNSGISRRAFLVASPLGITAQIKLAPKKAKPPLPVVGEFARITDPITENVIVRLTALTSSSVLPCERNHFVSARERTLIFSSDRSGRFAPYQIDLRTGNIRRLADPEKLNPKSLCLDRSEKSIHFLDGSSLIEVNLSHGAVHTVGEGYSTFRSSLDGTLFVISSGELRRYNKAAFMTLADSALDLWPQPNSNGCLFSRAAATDEREFCYVSSDGAGKPSMVASGHVREPVWDVDGESILFLRDTITPSGSILTEIHGRSIHGGNEYLVSPTSQFANFSPNSDASVFVGASRSRAQPTIILMLRTPRREMTLCEHRASHPGEVTPVFSPDNRRIYFESDHEGHSAIYSVNVELLVDPSRESG